MKVISGGQSGVDRAALDSAIEIGWEHGGWCPRGRLAEDGVISTRYNLVETPSSNYDERTEWNVRDADATLVILFGEPAGGTAYTIEIAKRMGKPILIISANDANAMDKVVSWLQANRVTILNVAGPRESTSPGIYQGAKKLLIRIFNAYAEKSVKPEVKIKM